MLAFRATPAKLKMFDISPSRRPNAGTQFAALAVMNASLGRDVNEIKRTPTAVLPSRRWYVGGAQSLPRSRIFLNAMKITPWHLGHGKTP